MLENDSLRPRQPSFRTTRDILEFWPNILHFSLKPNMKTFSGARTGAGQFFRAFHRRSADFQSAVSQVFNLPAATQTLRKLFHPRAAADCKSAIRQIENLRYFCPRSGPF